MSELTHAWYELREAGYQVTLASPQGGRVIVDGWSDPSHESGYSAHDVRCWMSGSRTASD